MNVKNIFYEKLKTVVDSNQVIIVTNENLKSVFANIAAYERNDDNDVWTEKFSLKGVIGKAGFGKKQEGDAKSPIGNFGISLCFGKYPNPGTKMPYQQCNQNDFWVDDPDSPFYNSWQTGPSQGRWKSAENLLREEDDLYDFAFAIDYNFPVIQGKGSAIFFHVWRPEVQEFVQYMSDVEFSNLTTKFDPEMLLNHDLKGTMGCTATSKIGMISMMKWLDPCKKPIIIQGPISEMAHFLSGNDCDSL